MSRGHGKLERAVLDALSLFPGHTASMNDIARLSLGWGKHPTRSQKSSLGRAIRNLQKAGLLVEVEHPDFRLWKLTATAEKEERREQRKAQRRQKKEEAAKKRFDEWARQQLGGIAGAARKRDKACDQLIKVLGVCGSSHLGERDAAARQIETIRQKLNLGWEEIFQKWFP